MFRGINAINIDAKGRMALPTRYRERLHQDNNGELVLTIDTEMACLLLYPMSEWEAIEKKIIALPSFNGQARRIQRLLIGHATEVKLDSHDRILLPALLRDYAKLDKKVMLVGQGKKFELWDETHWYENREMWLDNEAKKGELLPPEMQSVSL